MYGLHGVTVADRKGCGWRVRGEVRLNNSDLPLQPNPHRNFWLCATSSKRQENYRRRRSDVRAMIISCGSKVQMWSKIFFKDSFLLMCHFKNVFKKYFPFELPFYLFIFCQEKFHL